jgi:hypothetical protein
MDAANLLEHAGHCCSRKVCLHSTLSNDQLCVPEACQATACTAELDKQAASISTSSMSCSSTCGLMLCQGFGLQHVELYSLSTPARLNTCCGRREHAGHGCNRTQSTYTCVQHTLKKAALRARNMPSTSTAWQLQHHATLSHQAALAAPGFQQEHMSPIIINPCKP